MKPGLFQEAAEARQKMISLVVSSIKTINEYSEVQRSCSTCGHYEEVANSHVDRMWDPVCNVIKEGTGITIDVKPTGLCKRWMEKKPKEKV